MKIKIYDYSTGLHQEFAAKSVDFSAGDPTVLIETTSGTTILIDLNKGRKEIKIVSC